LKDLEVMKYYRRPGKCVGCFRHGKEPPVYTKFRKVLD
jgi:hypothetical protein